MLVSPAEPTIVKALGRVSPLPERLGADIVFVQAGRMYGVQRKELSDLISSLGDRLPREVIALTNSKVDVPVIIVEGRGTWTRDGRLVSSWGQPFSKEQLRRLIFSLSSVGIWVITTDNIEETVCAVLDLQAWAKKPRHESMVGRGSPPRAPWGKPGKREQDAWVLQGFAMIGPELARRLVDAFGGLPLTWAFTEEQLMAVPGIGPKRAAALMKALPPRPEMVAVMDNREEVRTGKRRARRAG